MAEKGSGTEEYRKKAKAELDRRIAQFEALLGSTLAPEKTAAAKQKADPDAETASAAAPLAAADTSPIHKSKSKNNAKKRTGRIASNNGGPDALLFAQKREKQNSTEPSSGENAQKQENIHKGHRQRMRESAARDPELESFSDVQLIEYYISFATPRRDTNPIAHKLLEKFGTPLGVFMAPYDELIKVKGVTAGAARMIVSLKMLASLTTDKRDIRLSSVADAADLFGAIFMPGGAGACAAYLDAGFELLASERTGELAVKPVVGAACRHGASYVLIAMRSDNIPDMRGIYKNVREIADTLALCGIKLIDCLAFTDFGYYTAADEGFMFYPYRAFVGSPELVAQRLGDAPGGGTYLPV